MANKENLPALDSSSTNFISKEVDNMTKEDTSNQTHGDDPALDWILTKAEKSQETTEEDHSFSVSDIFWQDEDKNPSSDVPYPSSNPYIAYEQQKVQKQQWEENNGGSSQGESTDLPSKFAAKFEVLEQKIKQKWAEADRKGDQFFNDIGDKLEQKMEEKKDNFAFDMKVLQEKHFMESERTRIRKKREQWVDFKFLAVDCEVGDVEEIEFFLPQKVMKVYKVNEKDLVKTPEKDSAIDIEGLSPEALDISAEKKNKLSPNSKKKVAGRFQVHSVMENKRWFLNYESVKEDMEKQDEKQDNNLYQQYQKQEDKLYEKAKEYDERLDNTMEDLGVKMKENKEKMSKKMDEIKLKMQEKMKNSFFKRGQDSPTKIIGLD